MKQIQDAKTEKESKGEREALIKDIYHEKLFVKIKIVFFYTYVHEIKGENSTK